MVPDLKWDGNFTKDRKIQDEIKVWNTPQRQKMIYRFDAHVGLEWKEHRTVGHGKQCSLEWSCVEENCHVLRKALYLEVEGERKKRRPKRTWKKQVEEKLFEKGRRTLPIEVECWCKSHCCWVEVNLATLTCWGHYQTVAGLRWFWPPSLVGDTTRLWLGWGDSGHPHLLGTLPDCGWVEVILATLTCWGHYQTVAGMRWFWPPSLVGDTTRLWLGWGDSGHPHLLGTLPDCGWVEVNLATLTCWGHYQILDIGVSLSVTHRKLPHRSLSIMQQK